MTSVNAPGSMLDPLIVERPSLGTLVVTGPERQSWLQGVITCDVKSLAPGAGAYGLALARNGRILTDVTVVVAPDVVYLGVPRERSAPVWEHLDRLLVMEDAELLDQSDEFVWTLAVGGPDDAWEGLGVAEAGARLARVPWPGLRGTAVVVAREHHEAVRDALLERVDAAAVAAPEQWERLRIEVGFASFGVDFDTSHTVHDASLEQLAVCWTKGCYVGQEVVARQQSRGVSPRRLVWLEVRTDVVPEAGTVVHHPADDRPVGEVTSATLSPRLGHVLAIARVSSAQAETGQRLVLGGAEATVATSAPFAAE